jgi:hypothetical protein
MRGPAAGPAVVGLVLYRPLTRKVRIWTGWADWCRIAATLSWADRWRLYWANATGRAVSERRLAPLAVQRAEAAQAMRQAGGATSRRWLGLAGVFLAMAALEVLTRDWIFAGMFALVGLTFAYYGVTVGAAKRSAEANRHLAERH